MGKRKIKVVVITAVVLAGVLLGIFFFPAQSEEERAQSALGAKSTADIGITYLPLIPKLSEYYSLGIDSGALVTEVASDSPAERAGIRVGDVITSFNGTRLGTEAPLLSMIMACRTGNKVTVEIWRQNNFTTVELEHAAR